ncbi:hypothetical protein BDV23DRAFT_191849 [Aspergillus alliaceus]|uniref:GED domain-containing protein n=1 Tax=Petromyces alliaceus TaxID=209559 RepID=A0A5N7BQY3_PETAA|nr:hypothetical protein BDV23DRAFT_191849 [Aspergillus alliaceus]
MVVRHFHTDALRDLCTQEQLDLLNSISSGKSSVLKAISGVGFLVKSNLGTRFPTELVLRKHPRIGVRLSIVPYHTRTKGAIGITTHGKAFLNDLLRVEVSGPDRPYLTIVHLPRLIYSETKQHIILAVVSAKNNFANQIVLKLARDADPFGKRTLGIITKPNTLIAGSESETIFISLAKNQDEQEFFSQGIWEDLPRLLVGIDTLRTRLSKRLGEPRATVDNQRSYLLKISQSLQELVKAAIDGTYNDPFFGDAHATEGYRKRIRAIVQNFNEEFAQKISQRGHYRRICEPNDGQIPVKNQVRVTREEYLKHIGHLLKGTRGRELPGTFNPMIVRDLFLEQCLPWEQLTRSHTDSIWVAAGEFLILVVKFVTDEATSAGLIEEVIIPACDSIKQEMDDKTRELLMPHQTGHPITYNHYFTETLQKIRAERHEGELAATLKRFFGVDNLSEPYCAKYSINLNQLLQSLQVALKRFVDDIANEVMESKLMFSLSRILSPVTVFDMPADLITRIAGESKDSQTIREQLNKELLILSKGSETCKRFVRFETDEGSLDPLLAAGCITGQSSDGFFCEETVSDTEESELSESSTERVDIPAALDEAVDGIPSASAKEEGKPNDIVIKRSKKKGRNIKDRKVILTSEDSVISGI